MPRVLPLVVACLHSVGSSAKYHRSAIARASLLHVAFSASIVSDSAERGESATALMDELGQKWGADQLHIMSEVFNPIFPTPNSYALCQFIRVDMFSV